MVKAQRRGDASSTRRAKDAIETSSVAAADASSSSDPKSRNRIPLVAAAIIIALQVALLLAVIGTRSDLSDLRAEVANNGLGGLSDLGSGRSSPGPTATTPAATSDVVTGNLPRFLGGGVDAALGRNIGDISALEYYTGENTLLSAADGVARAYMVWAHWCPYCQQELPLMAEWQSNEASEFAGVELISVTTAMDETASNPLVPYLDESQFPFPVLFDEDGSLARKLGVNAFPFWVFAAPDGTVVGRAAGYIEPQDLASVLRQLDDMAANQPSAFPALD